MKKIILLSTAALLLSPIAAKANQKSSILVGLKGSLERQMTGSSNVGGEDLLKAFEGENFLSGGLEAYYTYKVWNQLQIGAGLNALYAPEHKFPDAKKATVEKVPSAFVFEPRLVFGWAFQPNANLEITPYLGVGSEWSFSQNTTADKKTETKTGWNLPGFLGVRLNYASFYANLAGRFDLTAKDLFEGTTKEAKASARNGGVELSVGAEF